MLGGEVPIAEVAVYDEDRGDEWEEGELEGVDE